MNAADLLGGTHAFSQPPTTLLNWVSLVQEGLPFTCATELARHLGLTTTQLATILRIAPATLARRRQEGVLTTAESAQTLRIASTLERAIDVFESTDGAVAWLKSPNRAMGCVTPLSLLDTEVGAEAVRDVLGRIEHGVFS